jgi:hypothetical protein
MRTSVQPLIGNKVKFEAYGCIVEAEVIWEFPETKEFNCRDASGIYTVENKDIVKLKTGEGTYIKVDQYYIFNKASGRRYPGWK